LTLNENQLKAVNHSDGALLILAGAGSGKTRVIVSRVCRLINERGVKPWNILAITFTNKAAQEMKERILKSVPFGGDVVNVSTFHSMCVRILRRNFAHTGYTDNFSIYDSDDTKALLKEIYKDFNVDDKYLSVKSASTSISSAKNRMVSAQKYESEAAGDFALEQIAKIYKEYELRLKRADAMDFDDLLIKTVELFERCPEVLGYYQERFAYIHVDEYQDTNGVQFKLVEQLAKKHGNLCVVGDDDQSIYRFRGADIRNILGFESVFKDAAVIKLEQNYRSTPTILSAANAVISNNKSRKSKTLYSLAPDNGTIRKLEFESGYGEADFVAADIKRRINGGSPNGTIQQLRDIAILYRTNAQSRLFEERFVKAGIPYVVVGNVNFYSRMEVKDCLAYLRCVVNPQDDISLSRIINKPLRKIGQTTVEKLRQYAIDNGVSMWEVLSHADDVTGLGTAAGRLRMFFNLMQDFRKKADGIVLPNAGDGYGEREANVAFTPDEFLKYILEKTGYRQMLLLSKEPEERERLENVDELISKVKSFSDEQAMLQNASAIPDEGFSEIAGAEGMSGSAGASGFNGSAGAQGLSGSAGVSGIAESSGRALLGRLLQDISLVADIDKLDSESNVVKCMTLHSAKGLEFACVYMVGMEERVFPGPISIESPDPAEMEEERRLAYVGITRAKRDLTLTYARSRVTRGEQHYNAPSRFLSEIPQELFVDKQNSRSATFNSNSYVSKKPSVNFRQSFSVASNVAYKTTPIKHNGTIRGSTGSGGLSFTGAKRAAEFVKQRPNYDVGDRVRHIKFGDGTVTALEDGPKDFKVSVDFDERGKMNLLCGFAKMTKI